ncbi:MAG: HEAT repeat domain-containing protein [Candidatus Thorarchaeota archaeon]|nr:MAG: HEAT repeat domain-containing protein [Candidatus Thorarchaeota archaeon]
MSETRRLLLDYETEQVARLAKESSKNRNALIKAFSDTSEIVRERAILAAIDLADPTVIDDLLTSLQDEDDNVRIAAAQAIAWYQQPKTIPYMLQGLKDKNTWVRSHCAFGLSKLLRGPIWARVPSEDIDRILSGLSDMTEDSIRTYLSKLELAPDAIDRFVKWHNAKFEIEIDDTLLIQELEGKPIILPEGEEMIADLPVADIAVPRTAVTDLGISAEVEEILSELPDDIRMSLPPEDIRRLTPTRATELVEELKASFAEAEPEPAKKKKKVKVRKVKRVKKKAISRDELIEKIPSEVRGSVGEEVLANLSRDELEALIASTPDVEAAPAEPTEEEPSKKRRRKKELEQPKTDDKRFAEFIEKYGLEKAKVLIAMPKDMVDGIPEETIDEMDMETLKGLSEALEPM